MTKLEQLQERSRTISKLQKMLTKEQEQLLIQINNEKEKNNNQIEINFETLI